MVTLEARDVELVQQTVSDLRARGDVERAKAVETVLTVATAAAQGREPDPATDELLTLRQAARALSVTVRDIKSFAKDGGFPLLERSGVPHVRRDDLLAYVERLPASTRTVQARSASDDALAAELNDFVMAGLPTEKLDRLNSLHEKLEEHGRLTRAERRELVDLEREVLGVAGQRVEEWTEQLGATKLAKA